MLCGGYLQKLTRALVLNARQAVTTLTMSPAALYCLHLGSGGKVRYKSYLYLRYGGKFYTVFTREGESYKHLSPSAVNDGKPVAPTIM